MVILAAAPSPLPQYLRNKQLLIVGGPGSCEGRRTVTLPRLRSPVRPGVPLQIWGPALLGNFNGREAAFRGSRHAGVLRFAPVAGEVRPADRPDVDFVSREDELRFGASSQVRHGEARCFPCVSGGVQDADDRVPHLDHYRRRATRMRTTCARCGARNTRPRSRPRLPVKDGRSAGEAAIARGRRT